MNFEYKKFHPKNLNKLPRLLVLQSFGDFNSRFLEVRTSKCCMYRQLRPWFASNANAKIAAAIGADADVPVCFSVQMPRRSVVIICRSLFVPEEYVEANVEAQYSEYQGISSFSEVDEIEIV